MTVQEAIKNRLPSILLAISSTLAVVGVEVTEAEVSATVETALAATASLSSLYAAVRVWIDKVRGHFG